jgi:serine protease Do
MRKYALAAICAVALSSNLFGATPQLTDEQKRALELKPAVVLIVVSVKVSATLQGQPINLPQPYLRSAGSGFIYRPDGYIITNGHVVENAKINDIREKGRLEDQLKQMVYTEVLQAIDNEMKSEGKPGLTEEMARSIIARGLIGIGYSDPVLTVYLANGEHYVGDILQFSPEIGTGKDVAVVKIPTQNLPTVDLGDSDRVSVQDSVTAIGYPGITSEWGGNALISEESNLVPSVTDGHISAIKKMATTETPVLQSDVTITHGNSGGPVFNAAGQAIGIATFGSPANSGQGETAGFNFLVPINVAMEFVHAAGVQAQSGPFNQHWAKALDMYSGGECRGSLSEFDNTLQFMPDLPEAKQYRALAVQCTDNERGLKMIMDEAPWAPYAGVAVVLVGIAAFLLLKMRRPAVAAAPAPAPAVVTRAEVARPAVLPAATPAASFGSLQATAGALSGKTFKITKDGVLIGRSPKCQVVLPDDTVSSEHAWIVPLDQGVVVIDKGSSNGTFVNSTDSPRVSKVGLRNGDRIYIGKKGTSVFTYFSS